MIMQNRTHAFQLERHRLVLYIRNTVYSSDDNLSDEIDYW